MKLNVYNFYECPYIEVVFIEKMFPSVTERNSISI